LSETSLEELEKRIKRLETIIGSFKDEELTVHAWLKRIDERLDAAKKAIDDIAAHIEEGIDKKGYLIIADAIRQGFDLLVSALGQPPSGMDEPATEKQIAFLKRLGVEIPENLTKREASRMIDDALREKQSRRRRRR